MPISTIDPLPDVPIENLVVVLTQPGMVGYLPEFYREGGNITIIPPVGAEYTTITAIIGQTYECSLVPSNPVAKDEDGESLGLDRLTTESIYVTYELSGDVTATTTDTDGNEKIVALTYTRALQHRVGIKKRSKNYSIKFKTISHYPLVISGIEYKCNLNRRGRRI